MWQVETSRSLNTSSYLCDFLDVIAISLASRTVLEFHLCSWWAYEIVVVLCVAFPCPNGLWRRLTTIRI